MCVNLHSTCSDYECVYLHIFTHRRIYRKHWVLCLKPMWQTCLIVLICISLTTELEFSFSVFTACHLFPFLSFFVLLILTQGYLFPLLFSESGGWGEREREKETWVWKRHIAHWLVASHTALTLAGDWTWNPGIYPWPKMESKPFGVQANALTTEEYQPGLFSFL